MQIIAAKIQLFCQIDKIPHICTIKKFFRQKEEFFINYIINLSFLPEGVFQLLN